ncbi:MULTISPECIES: hypothetical protein [unclassified Polaribacter]|uniref:hypothetical protein n=1 Tax=unclassified Polaribacter TaxID=196858 RepID=UPI0011BF4549|nr:MULTISPECIES: hypothetical protein [unclassified Polaribacter]TXD48159.1 hypothetical protein ES043_17935 [Polaribacter sp. IC063]TXD55641.1 hypothetical protein ES044_17865 [Polaribacter sp. IC066]
MTNAYFTYEYEGEIGGLFEDDDKVERTLAKIKLPQIKTIEYLKRVILTSKLNLFKKENPISLEFDSLYDIFPEQINTKQINQSIKFKSKQIKLMNLKKQNITFSNHEDEIINIELPKNYKLYKG